MSRFFLVDHGIAEMAAKAINYGMFRLLVLKIVLCVLRAVRCATISSHAAQNGHLGTLSSHLVVENKTREVVLRFLFVATLLCPAAAD